MKVTAMDLIILQKSRSPTSSQDLAFSRQSSHTMLSPIIPHKSHPIHLTPLITESLISHHSSHTTHHTPLISQHSSHISHLTALISQHSNIHYSSYKHLTPLISYQTHIQAQDTKLHMWAYPVLLLFSDDYFVFRFRDVFLSFCLFFPLVFFRFSNFSPIGFYAFHWFLQIFQWLP